jgi:hypothetical protein
MADWAKCMRTKLYSDPQKKLESMSATSVMQPKPQNHILQLKEKPGWDN